jgi:hypothetical protein
MFSNHKAYFSHGILGVADPNCRSVYVDIGSYGEDRDSEILNDLG